MVSLKMSFSKSGTLRSRASILAKVVLPAAGGPVTITHKGRSFFILDVRLSYKELHIQGTVRAIWLPSLDSNQDYLIQSQACYHYTTRQFRPFH